MLDTNLDTLFGGKNMMTQVIYNENRLEHFEILNRLVLIFTKFRIKDYLVLVHSCTKFEIDNLKFAWVRKFKENFKEIQSQKI